MCCRFKYVSDMRTLVDVFIKPLRRALGSGTAIISSDDTMKLFSVAEQILEVNDELLSKINERLMDTQLSILIGETFSKVSLQYRIIPSILKRNYRYLCLLNNFHDLTLSFLSLSLSLTVTHTLTNTV